MPLKRAVPVVLAISLLGAGLSFGLAGASPETDSDQEYDAAVASDSSGAKETDEFVKIEKSVEKPLMKKSAAKAARSTAVQSVAGLEPYDQNWTGKSPKLFGKPVPFYLDDGEPFAYEWKIRCGGNPDCGSITVATLENEYRVIETATSWKANYERLGSGKASKSNRLYYYSAVEKFVQSADVSGIEVMAMDPNKKSDPNLASELAGKKAGLRDYRKSGKLRFDKEQPLAGALYGTGTATVNVPGTNLGTCGGPLPCYGQFTTTYGWSSCYSWCAPTALAIIFWYYDRKGAFPNLLPGVVASDTVVNQPMVKSIASYMQTVCVWSDGGTNIANYPLWMQYARNMGYTNSGNGTVLTGNVAIMVGRLQTEIQAGRPVMVHYYINVGRQAAHVMAAYWYRTNTSPTPTDIHVNFGWGWLYPDAYIPSSWIVTQAQAGNGNPVAGMWLGGVVTVPMQ